MSIVRINQTKTNGCCVEVLDILVIWMAIRQLQKQTRKAEAEAEAEAESVLLSA